MKYQVFMNGNYMNSFNSYSDAIDLIELLEFKFKNAYIELVTF